VVVENILRDGGSHHVIEPHLDLRQGKEFLWLRHCYQKKNCCLILWVSFESLNK
jgi:hypothetical protein